jgi:hypothetical protein
LKSLPASVAKYFEAAKVVVLDTIAQMDPWKSVSDEELVKIWNHIFDHE